MMYSLLLLSAPLLSGSIDTARVASRTSPVVQQGAPAVAVAQADSIVVEKGERKLTLFLHGSPLKSYAVALGPNPVGDKERQGDGRTPEGVFHIQAHNPNSKYHLALKISYPDVTHQMRADALGIPAGGDIMIHGLPKGFESVGAAHLEQNWTEGCVAVTNAEIEEIWRAVRDGTPVEIKP
jgi:murein L,D-transpeptidase YafK